MKKIITTATVVLLTQFASIALLAQSKKSKSFDEDIKISTRGGIGISTLSSSDAENTGQFKAGLGYFLGGIAEYRPKGSFGLLGGIAFEGKGASFNTSGTGLYFDYASYNLGYLDVMLGGVFYPAKKFKFEAALVPAFKISESVSYSYLGIRVINAETNSIKSVDLGAMLGMHYEFDKFTLGASYNLGLSNAAKENSDFKNLKNSNFLLNISYNIEL